VPKKIAKRLPVDQARANRSPAGVRPFLLAIGAWCWSRSTFRPRPERSAGEAVGRSRLHGQRLPDRRHQPHGPRAGRRVVTDELAALDRKTKAPQPLVDVAAIRERLLQFGWVKDARVSRRLPDTLVIDIVERTPAALWQDEGPAVADRRRRRGARPRAGRQDARPAAADRPRRQRPGAQLEPLLAEVPTLKPQLARRPGSAAPLGPQFPVGRDVALPEGEARRSRAGQIRQARQVGGLLGRGIVRFDLRIPGKMTVRLPRAPGEPIAPNPAAEG
jgi:cell division protein FtsQ